MTLQRPDIEAILQRGVAGGLTVVALCEYALAVEKQRATACTWIAELLTAKPKPWP
jgi:hypothetical protein